MSTSAVIYLAEPPLEGDAALACAISVIADPRPPKRTATGQTSHEERRAQTTLTTPMSPQHTSSRARQSKSVLTCAYMYHNVSNIW